MEHHHVDALTQDVSDKPAASGEDGVWQTTQLDSAIGDLQRRENAQESVGDAGGKDVVDTSDGAAAAAAASKRGARKKRRAKPPRVIPTIRVYVGTFVHSTADNPLVVLERWMIGVDAGKIIFSQSASEYKRMIEQYKLNEFVKECIISLPEGSLMMPGFIDCHTHVVSYLLAGLRWKFDSALQGGAAAAAVAGGNGERRVNERRLRTMNVIADDKSAANLFATYVSLSIMNGITCAAYNGSVVESAARLLVDTVVRLKQRALVGLEMYYGDNRDDTHLFQLIKAHDVAHHIRRKHCDRVQPCMLLSKPLPDWLEARVAELAAELDLRVKLVVGDEKTESLKEKLKGWVELGSSSSSLIYHKKHSLLNNNHQQSMIVNCSQCSTRELRIISKLGCPVIHCPSADLLSYQFHTLQKLCKHNITVVGLGTDLNTSHSVSMLETIRTASLCIKLSSSSAANNSNNNNNTTTNNHRKKSSASSVDCSVHHSTLDMNGHSSCPRSTVELNDSDWNDRKESASEDDDDDEAVIDHDHVDDDVISYKDLFRMATLGGATVLGLDEIIGNFEVGKEFDALLVEPRVNRSKFVVVSNFDTVQDVVEKFIFLGDDRNITQVFIGGERVV